MSKNKIQITNDKQTTTRGASACAAREICLEFGACILEFPWNLQFVISVLPRLGVHQR